MPEVQKWGVAIKQNKEIKLMFYPSVNPQNSNGEPQSYCNTESPD